VVVNMIDGLSEVVLLVMDLSRGEGAGRGLKGVEKMVQEVVLQKLKNRSKRITSRLRWSNYLRFLDRSRHELQSISYLVCVLDSIAFPFHLEHFPTPNPNFSTFSGSLTLSRFVSESCRILELELPLDGI